MKYLVTLLMLFWGTASRGQTDDGLLSAKMVALDTTITGAAAFNLEILKCVPGYELKFLDKQNHNELRYLYEHSNHETLKLEYTYRQREADSSGSKPKPYIFMQRIIAEANSIAAIYHCIFGEPVQAVQLEAFSGHDLGFTFRDREYHYSLLPDDYKPGYWVLLITQ